ncbi:Mating-type switching protein swi10 [Golovinomyces cichoracearum]|uniref:Mating-type switching protein swi10 n=1 Tax=Golovinomyces cichoracearum TaxID=62708 RepID=A0A420HJ86_9PEZI|nr:Mating-type switching protein swi10 [Golovinomyces cichoracearum]
MEDDDEFGADADFLEALAAASDSVIPTQTQISESSSLSLNIQPSPQRLDRPTQVSQAALSAPKVIQPTPQILPSRASASSILVSPRQKGNPILINLRSFVWEYSDIPADYVLGTTTCALFLSLKYHRLHPEYIYNRIKDLQGKFNLRVLLTLVDIMNHEDVLKELTKTSLVNNVTIILCWSTAEAARYLELYKSYEHSKDSIGIKGIEKKGYAEKMVEFITVPRGINKTDAVSIVSAFGSIKNAINARAEEVAVVCGWGEKKVRRWCSVVDKPFQVRNTQTWGKGNDRNISGQDFSTTSVSPSQASGQQNKAERTCSERRLPSTEKNVTTEIENTRDPVCLVDDAHATEAIDNNLEENKEKLVHDKLKTHQRKEEEELSGGIISALAKLRRENG